MSVGKNIINYISAFQRPNTGQSFIAAAGQPPTHPVLQHHQGHQVPPMMQDPLQLQANFQPYPRLNQVQSDPMYPIVGSPVTPQPPPLQPMWVQAPQPPPVPPMPVMQQMPSYPPQFQTDQPIDHQAQHQPPPSRQNFRHRRFGKGPVRSS